MALIIWFSDPVSVKSFLLVTPILTSVKTNVWDPR
jgi:hypothetical protein